jgi:hypothetical protein
LIFTDADFIVPPAWAEGLLRYFADPQFGVVFGQLAFCSSRFLEGFQSYD